MCSLAPPALLCVRAREADIVRRREDRDNVFLMTPIVPFHDELMCSRHECQPVVMVELLGDILAEGVARAAGTDAPTATIVGITPQ